MEGQYKRWYCYAAEVQYLPDSVCPMSLPIRIRGSKSWVLICIKSRDTMKKLSIIIFLIGLVGPAFVQKTGSKLSSISCRTRPEWPVVIHNHAQEDQCRYADHFAWSAASFGLHSCYNHRQMDKRGNNFKDPLAVGTVTECSIICYLTSA